MRFVANQENLFILFQFILFVHYSMRKDVFFFGLVTSNVSCDACQVFTFEYRLILKSSISEGETQFHCLDCKNFDLCEECYKKSKNKKGHRFVKERGVHR